ncbi:hypothetical protein [Granulicella paludicola]|uniref:hypothetical protein n=1 Tax=Granulicella paludicola TaxID=474951 RepID=UPI0021DFDDF3|nr:hypothetical protein [Granulicella paludicola]
MFKSVSQRPSPQIAKVLLCFGFTALTGALLLHPPQATAQAIPTATVGIFPSLFAGATATDTGFNSGKNIAVTGGLDVGFYSGRRFEYALEYRGIYPVSNGEVDRQKSNLIGFNLSTRPGRLHPYGDIFYGRAEVSYAGAGAEVPGTPIFYTKSSSSVIAVGGGATFDLGSQFALRFDALFQRFDVPVTASGHLYPTSASIDFIYRIRHRGMTGDRQLEVNRGK